MTLSASEFHSYYKPSPCELRVFLLAHGAVGAPAGPYAEVVRQLGAQHEAKHLGQLGPYLDLRPGQALEREERTRRAIDEGIGIIYHPRLRAAAPLNGGAIDVVGEPDYLIRVDGGYAIRDSKVARRINEDDHPEILRQVETYGWLYERAAGRPPAQLQVHAGTDEIIDVPYDGGKRALALIEQIAGWQTMPNEPYRAVSWSGCGPCGFNDRCVSDAADRRDPALIPDVDKNLAMQLHQDGVKSWDELRTRYDEPTLAELRRPWGKGMQRVGKKAGRILISAEALAEDKAIWLAAPALPAARDWVMFDLEGFPPQLDEDQKIFVWGLQVFGDHPGQYSASVPGFEADGDEMAWRGFLRDAANVFRQHGDIPFVHWAHYERDRLAKYIDRYGDLDGVGARVMTNLLDLLPVVRDAVALPLPSYSLKVVEQYVGYERSQVEYGGEWAMATYFQAMKLADRSAATVLVDEVLKYNREDLEATWAVFRWLLAGP